MKDHAVDGVVYKPGKTGPPRNERVNSINGSVNARREDQPRELALEQRRHSGRSGNSSRP